MGVHPFPYILDGHYTMTAKNPVVLLVESKRSTFTAHVLSRSDIDAGLLRVSSEPHVSHASGIPTFTLSPHVGLAQEVERFREWAHRIGFYPEFFCNPNEALQHVAQAFARLVELPSLTERQVEIVRNKMAMKDFYQEQGIPCAKYAKVDSTVDVENFAVKHGFPVIVKPIDSNSCIETYKINSAGELRSLSGNISWMVESYIESAEYQICAIIANGKVLDAYIAKNPVPIIEVFDGAINVNITLAPSEDKPIDALNVMQNITSRLALSFGYLHGEFFITSNGDFVMSEIAARLSGCEVPLNHAYAYGFDFLGAIMDTYVGRTPALSYTSDRAVGDLLLPAPAGVVTYISSENELRSLEGVISCKLNYQVGNTIVPMRASGFCSGYVQAKAEIQMR